MATNNGDNMSSPGFQALSAGAFLGRTITGTTNQIAITNGDGISADSVAGFDTFRVLNTQPCVLATLATTVTNVTGEGTSYTVIFDTASLNQGSRYSTGTGVFTSNANGIYYFFTSLTLSGLTASNTLLFASLAITAGSYICRQGKRSIIQGSDGYTTIEGGFICTLPNTNTFRVLLQSNGSVSKNVNIIGGGKASWLYGFKIC